MSFRSIFFTLSFIVILFSSCTEETERKSTSNSSLHKNAQVNLENIETIYRYKCSICHGKNGVSIVNDAPDLVSTEFTIEERVAIIVYGKGTMPPQKDVLDMPTIRGLAVYIDSLK